jgi:hypothetical protein
MCRQGRALAAWFPRSFATGCQLLLASSGEGYLILFADEPVPQGAG